MFLCLFRGFKVSSVLLALLFSSSLFAAIAVKPLVIYFNKSMKPYQDVMVSNNGKQTAYVEASVVRVDNIGTAAEKTIQDKNPKKLGMLVTPKRLALSPGQSRNVRIGLLKPYTKQEQFYRIHITPKENKFEFKGKKDTFSAGVRIIIAYDVKVRVAPLHPVSKVALARQGKQLTLINNGNLTTVFLAGEQCHKDICVGVSSHAVYPGQKAQITLKHAWPVNFTVINAAGPQNLLVLINVAQ